MNSDQQEVRNALAYSCNPQLSPCAQSSVWPRATPLKLCALNVSEPKCYRCKNKEEVEE